MFHKTVYLLLFLVGIIIVSTFSIQEPFTDKKQSMQQVFDTIKDTQTILQGFCKEEQHNYESLEEEERRILLHYIRLSLHKINKESATKSRKHIPYHFSFIEIIKASSATDTFGNARWKVDIMVEERTYHTSVRLEIDFIIFITTQNQSVSYKNIPLPLYLGGFPSTNQMIPLPEEVISSGIQGIVLSHTYKNPDYPTIKELVIHDIQIIHNDHVLGYDKITNCPSTYKSDMEYAPYTRKSFTRKDVSFFEKEYADSIEEKNQGIDTDIVLQDTWTPCNIQETNSHTQSNTETFDNSTIPIFPEGWIQPSVLRNKWHRLWSEPRDRVEYPSNEKPKEWDTTGVRKCINVDNTLESRWSTIQTPRTPLYWPTVTGIPRNESVYDNLFTSFGNVVPNMPH